MLAWRVRNLFPLRWGLFGWWEISKCKFWGLDFLWKTLIVSGCWEIVVDKDIKILVSYGYKVITLAWFSMNFCRKNWSHNNVHLNTSGWPMFQFLAILFSLWTSIGMKFLLTRYWDTKELMIVYCLYEPTVYMLSTLPLKLCSGWYDHGQFFIFTAWHSVICLLLFLFSCESCAIQCKWNFIFWNF